jgi:cobalt-zinc-cadmium efflux system outer membrane protein
MSRWPWPLSIYLLCGFWPVCVTAQTAAPPALTIPQAVQEALEHNLNLLAERYNVSVAEARVITAGLRPNPVLSTSANIVDHTIFRSGTNPYDEAVRLDFVFERGGKRERRLEVAENARAVAQLQLLNTIRTLMLDVEKACVEVLLAKANVALAQENLQSLNSVVEINTHRVRAGDLAEVELTRTQLAALQFQNQVRKSESDLIVARKELQALLGRSLQEGTVDVVGDLRREGQPVNQDAVLHQALTLRPDFQALQREQARSTAELRLQIAQGKVDYTIGAEYHRQQGNVREGSVFSLYFSAPLPVFNRNQGEIARAQQEQEQIAVKLRALETDIHKEVQTTSQRYTTTQEIMQRIETQMLEQAQEVRNIMEYTYRRGSSSLVEFLDAQRTFNETRQNYNEARADHAKSLYQLDAVSGASVNPAAGGVP